MVTASYSLQVDWNVDGNYTGTYDDITTDITPGAALVYSWGRQAPITLPGAGESAAGKLDVELFNTAGKYSSLNASSPIFGLIKPGRPVRLQATYAAVTYTLWTGYLDKITPAAPQFGVLPKAHLTAFGALSRLVEKRISPAPSAGALTGTIAATIFAAAGVTNYVASAGITTTSRWYVPPDTLAIDALRDIEATEAGFVAERKDGYILFQDRQYRLVTAACMTSNCTFTDAANAVLGYTEIEQQDTQQALINEVTALVPRFTVAAIAVLWTLGETGLEIGPGQTREFIAEYPNAGNAPGAYVETWTTPVPGTDITSANGDAATYLTVATTFAGSTALPFKGPNHMRISITNTHTINTAVLTLVQARGTAVTFADGIRVLSEDATSKTAYGRRTYDFPGKWLPSAAVAQGYADYLVSAFKAPVVALRLGYRANLSAGHMVQALSRELSDRITAIANGVTQLGLSQDWYIEWQEHRIEEAGMRHSVTYLLSPTTVAGAQPNYWILGTSALGTDTVLAF